MKQLFNVVGVKNIKIIELDKLSNGTEMQDELAALSKQRTARSPFCAA